MPRVYIPSVQTYAFIAAGIASGPWRAPPGVTHVRVSQIGTGGSFDGTSIPNGPGNRVFSVTPGSTYTVVSASTATLVTWIGDNYLDG